MNVKLLQGQKISEKILNNLKLKINRGKIRPTLAVILVGSDKASRIYVTLKEKAAEKIGIKFSLHKFKELAAQTEIIKKIKKLNNDQKISGLIVQLPLPGKFNAQKIIDAIDPQKDADGFHPQNIKLFLKGKGEVPARNASRSDTGGFPVFPKAIMRILEFSQVSLKNKKALVIANSQIFGETMKAALKQENIKADYILAKDLKNSLSKIKNADILITAVGKPNLIKSEMIKKGALIVDGGITKKGKKVLGDVDFASVKNKAAYLTPVPGGVGPVTIACLLENVYLLSKNAK